MKFKGLMWIWLIGVMFSGGANASVGMPSYQIPDYVGINPDGTLEIIFPEVFNSGCTNGDGKRMYIRVGNSQGVTEESFVYIKSMILTALTAQKPIKIWYDRLGNKCEGGKVVITN